MELRVSVRVNLTTIENGNLREDLTGAGVGFFSSSLEASQESLTPSPADLVSSSLLASQSSFASADPLEGVGSGSTFSSFTAGDSGRE